MSARPRARTVKLDALGLVVDVEGEAEPKVTDVGNDNFLVEAGNVAFFVDRRGEVAETPEAELTNIDAGRASEGEERGRPENVEKQTLPDGWALLFDLDVTAGLSPLERLKAGDAASHFITVRRVIKGDAVSCTSVLRTDEDRQVVLRACTSLRAQ